MAKAKKKSESTDPIPPTAPLTFTKTEGPSADSLARYDCDVANMSQQIALSASCPLAAYQKLELSAVEIQPETPPE